jgi:CheY-like chemotaxis protein
VSHKLLLADDSITIQKVVELILAEEDFEIKSTSNGEEALAAVSSFKPDIILADIDMPKMNGYQLCEKIKQAPSTGTIPVILLAGAFEPVDEELAHQVKADDFIIKPFESQDLISKINSLLAVPITAEEAEEVVEAEAIGVEAEAIGLEEAHVLEEDLWAMEEIPETTEIKGWPAEEGAAAGLEEFIEIAEEAPLGAEALIAEEPLIEKPKAAEGKIAVPEMIVPSKEELTEVFKNTVNQRISSVLSSLDIKEAILASLMPLLKDSVEKILWEVAPDLVEKTVKEMVKGTFQSLSKDVEKVIWDTVPDLAETIISKEIERIKAEF